MNADRHARLCECLQCSIVALLSVEWPLADLKCVVDAVAGCVLIRCVANEDRHAQERIVRSRDRN